MVAGILLLGAAAVLVLVATRAPSAIRSRSQVGKSLAIVRRVRVVDDRTSTASLHAVSPTRSVHGLVEQLRRACAGAAMRVGQRLTPRKQQSYLAKQLDRAGHPYKLTVDRLVLLKTLGLAVGVAIAALLLATAGIGGPTLLASGLVALCGYFAADVFVYQAAHNRSERILAGLADTLDLLTVSVEAGLAFDAALQQVSRNTDGPLADEFARVLREMHLGTGRSAALQALGDRTKVEDLQRFAATVAQADKLGVPIARVLRVQAVEMRTKRSQRAEESAHKVPVKILFPLILCIMPALFIVILGPAAIQIMTTMPRG